MERKLIETERLLEMQKQLEKATANLAYFYYQELCSTLGTKGKRVNRKELMDWYHEVRQAYLQLSDVSTDFKCYVASRIKD